MDMLVPSAYVLSSHELSILACAITLGGVRCAEPSKCSPDGCLHHTSGHGNACAVPYPVGSWHVGFSCAPGCAGVRPDGPHVTVMAEPLQDLLRKLLPLRGCGNSFGELCLARLRCTALGRQLRRELGTGLTPGQLSCDLLLRARPPVRGLGALQAIAEKLRGLLSQSESIAKLIRLALRGVESGIQSSCPLMVRLLPALQHAKLAAQGLCLTLGNAEAPAQALPGNLRPLKLRRQSAQLGTQGVLPCLAGQEARAKFGPALLNLSAVHFDCLPRGVQLQQLPLNARKLGREVFFLSCGASVHLLRQVRDGTIIPERPRHWRLRRRLSRSKVTTALEAVGNRQLGLPPS
mmetsp:Transcript_81227/g.230086  ORF Transcript_81227/g.230086 Transcript_81227/m.230086 type:complete len:349 (+) Transcript_81227:707-1753(+)